MRRHRNRHPALARLADEFLTVAAVAFLVAYAVPIIWPSVSHDVVEACDVVTWAVWGLFTVDYLAHLKAAPDRRLYVRKHWLDLLVILLPLLRPLRLLRLVTMLRFIDANATNRLRGRIVTYVIGGASLLSFVAALAVLEAERETAGSNIETFGDALWWSFATMTTVGYGDKYPVTTVGRFVAVGLMIGGVAILSTVTATIASWMVERVAADVAAEASSPEASAPPE